jgi:zinc protease
MHLLAKHLLALLLAAPAADADAPAAPLRVAAPPLVALDPPPPAPSALARTFTTGATHDPIHVQERRLANGLTVLISEDPNLPRIFGAVVVRAGSKHDPAHATGIAHYLEHMLFKGTRELGTVDYTREAPHLLHLERLYERLRGAATDADREALLVEIDRAAREAGRYAIPGELDRALHDLGATGVNAFTTPDITVYHNELPPRSLEAWLALTAHRFRDPVFRLFPSELEAVYEEKNRAMDGLDPIADAFLARFFPGHPYGAQTTLGSVEHLKSPSLREMREFYRRHYVASNMALVLAGDLDAAAIWPIIEETFGTWPKEQPPPPLQAALEPLVGRLPATIRMTPVRALGLGFRLPPDGHPDHAAVLVVNELLSNPQSAGLLDQLSRSGDVLLAQAVPIPLDEQGVGLLAAVPRLLTQTFHSAERHLLAQLAKLHRGEFSDIQLHAARRALLLRAARQWETAEGRALAMVTAFGRRQAWSVVIDHLQRLAAVDRPAVQQAAERYFGRDYLALRSRVGLPPRERLKKPTLTPIQPAKGARSAFAAQLAARHQRPRTAKPPRFIDFDADIQAAPVAPGVVVHTNTNPYATTLSGDDLYTLELRHGLGKFHRRELWVLGEYLLAAGAADHPGEAFGSALFELATTLQIEATEEALIFRLEGPEEHLSAALALLQDLLEAPADDPRALRRVRRERWGRARVERSQPSVLADALRERVTFGELSTYRRDYSPRQLLHLTPTDLHRALAAARRHAAEIRYTGARTPQQVAELANNNLRFFADLRPATAKVVRPRLTPDRDQVYWLKRRRSLQSQIYLAIEGEPLTDEQRPAALAFTEHLGGGMGGLIFRELRELRGLAYAARAAFYEAPVAGHPGIFLAYLATQGDKTLDALAVLDQLLQRHELTEEPDHIDGLRTALIRAQEVNFPSFRGLQEQVDRWRAQGHREDPRRALLPALEKITSTDLRRFYAAHLADRPRVLMLIADPRRIDRTRLRERGQLITLNERDLFAP